MVEPGAPRPRTETRRGMLLVVARAVLCCCEDARRRVYASTVRGKQQQQQPQAAMSLDRIPARLLLRLAGGCCRGGMRRFMPRGGHESVGCHLPSCGRGHCDGAETGERQREPFRILDPPPSRRPRSMPHHFFSERSTWRPSPLRRRLCRRRRRRAVGGETGPIRPLEISSATSGSWRATYCTS